MSGGQAEEAATAVHRSAEPSCLGVSMKSSPMDLVTAVDREAERQRVSAIGTTRPHDAMHSQYTWVLFDLDDTLISRTPNIVQQANIAALQLLSAHAHEMPLLTEHLAHVYQHTTQGNGVLVSKQEQFRQLLHRLGRSESVEPLFAAYIASYVSGIQVFPDVHATFSTLQGHGVHIGIATNGPPDVVEAVLQHCEVRQFVRCVVTPAHVGAVKPAQAFATFAVAQAGVNPRQILFVGDRAEDILTAKRMGAVAVLVDRGSSLPLEVQPDYIVQTLSDILPLCLSIASCAATTTIFAYATIRSTKTPGR